MAIAILKKIHPQTSRFGPYIKVSLYKPRFKNNFQKTDFKINAIDKKEIV